MLLIDQIDFKIISTRDLGLPKPMHARVRSQAQIMPAQTLHRRVKSNISAGRLSTNSMKGIGLKKKNDDLWKKLETQFNLSLITKIENELKLKQKQISTNKVEIDRLVHIRTTDKNILDHQ